MQEFSFSGAINSQHFFIIFITVILCFALIGIWLEFLNRFFYNYLGFNKNSALDAFFIAMFLTFIVSCMGYLIKRKYQK